MLTRVVSAASSTSRLHRTIVNRYTTGAGNLPLPLTTLPPPPLTLPRANQTRRRSAADRLVLPVD
jgi:hypothetical protein